MCRSCGAIVGAGETQCGVCGVPTASQPADASQYPPADKETVRFARAVLNRPYKFTIALLVANVFIFLLMWESSGMAFTVLQRGFPEIIGSYKTGVPAQFNISVFYVGDIDLYNSV